MVARAEVLRGAWAWGAVCLLAACHGSTGAPGDCALPQGGVYATFRMPATPPPVERSAEEFHVWLTSSEGISSAIDAWQGRTAAHIPAGFVVCAPAKWNCGWVWHFDPATVKVVESSIELCDGGPPHNVAECQSLIDNVGGQFCPWSAQFIDLRDCRGDASCPAMPH